MNVVHWLSFEGFKLVVRLLRSKVKVCMLKTEVMLNLSPEVIAILMGIVPSYTINTN